MPYAERRSAKCWETAIVSIIQLAIALVDDTKRKQEDDLVEANVA